MAVFFILSSVVKECQKQARSSLSCLPVVIFIAFIFFPLILLSSSTSYSHFHLSFLFISLILFTLYFL